MTGERLSALWRDDRRFERFFLAGVFVAFCGLALLFPYSGDDWAWGSAVGIERLQTLFANYNGRYVGDLAILLLTRMGFLSRITVAAVVTLTIFLILDLSENRSRSGYLVTVALFLAMPLGLWREGVVWLSGFSNYALAALLMLIYLRAAKRDWQAAGEGRKSAVGYAGVLLLGFVSALCVEHVTLYLVVASVCVLIAHRRRFGRFSAEGLCWTGSFISGALMMFSNGAYRLAAAPDPAYQVIRTSAGGSAITELVGKVMDTIAGLAIAQNVALDAVLVVLICLLAARAADGGAAARRRRYLPFGLACGGVFLMMVAAQDLSRRLVFRSLSGAGAMLLLAAILLTASTLLPGARDRLIVWVAALSVVVLIAPLAIVDPIGPRCFLPTYLLMLVIVAVFSRNVADLAGGRYTSWSTVFFALVSLVLLATNIFIYASVSSAASTRLEAIRGQAATGQTRIATKKLPFPGYVHAPDPLWYPLDYRFNLFYGLPGNLKFTFK